MSHLELVMNRLPPGARWGWHGRNEPGRALHRLLRGSASDLWTDRYHATWMQHIYMYPLANCEWAYVAEPYYLTDRDLDEIRLLRQLGYDVTIRADHARWNPGRTVAITITPLDMGPA